VKLIDYWKIVALVGTIIFLVSGFLPMISASEFSFSLFNLYTGSVTIDAGVIGILLTIILYPVAVILGFVSILKRKVAMVAGIVGLICWIGTLAYLAQANAVSHAGVGIYVGIAGAVIITIAYFLKASLLPTQTAALDTTLPPPPPPQ
jgi:hypothetical protein